MELIDIYDALGQKSGRITDKDETHRKAFIHKCICVWIINSKNGILLQTRSAYVMLFHKLDIFISGYIQAGETVLEAMCRGGKEEFGIDISTK